MMKQSWLPSRAFKRAVQLGTASLAIAGMGAASGCLSRPIEPIVPQTTSVVVERLTQSAVNKIDLLLDIDNSSSMGDKQSILALAVPQLVNGLVNPNCLDNNTGAIVTPAPAGPLDMCPTGSTRDFPPVLDIHIGLVSSSLGTFGADGCPDPPAPPAAPAVCPAGSTDNDHGHLLTRSDPCGQDAAVPTFMSQGFLAWDPSTNAPAGAIGTTAALNMAVTSLVTGDGQLGCGFESQNESWYRFLVDPSPYATITMTGDTSTPSTTGNPTAVDTVLLQQRNDFLRPDSLLAIITVTDETDTSIKEFGIYPLFAQTTQGGQPYHLPHGTAACTAPPPALGPLDPCCVSCGENMPAGCAADPNCGNYNAQTEDVSIRAFGLSGGLQSHKARYGIEFFYQPSRYVNALTASTIANSANAQVTNPIYNILPGNDISASVRDPGLVFYAAITGVPWQLIARENPSTGLPDLIAGVDSLDPTQVGGFKSSAELNQLDKTGQHTFWEDIAGDPENYVLPISPFMQESTVPRTGTDPITGQTISPVTATTFNPINGHERTIPAPPGDIEYACIFQLPTPRDCTTAVGGCDCNSTTPTDNPLCDPTTPTQQDYAKAYPGVKNLAIAEGLGDQGIAASICPAQLNTADPTAADFGYNPAVNAIIARLKQALHGECLPRTLTWDLANLEVNSCLILEASKVADPATDCTCAGPARQQVQQAHLPAEQAAELDPLAATAKWNCFCEINEIPSPPTAPSSSLLSCLETVGTVTDTTANGWCYVDSGEGPKEAAVVAKCPSSEEHEIRFVGTGQPVSGSTLFITCAGT